MVEVTLYGKPGCHLCDDARDAILRVRNRLPFDLIEKNINEDTVLARDFGQRIPVVWVGGRYFCEYIVREDELARRIEALRG